MVIDFAASWCGPCKIMEPELRKMASTYSDVQFVKIDVDELSVCSLFFVLFFPFLIKLNYIYICSLRERDSNIRLKLTHTTSVIIRIIGEKKKKESYDETFGICNKYLTISFLFFLGWSWDVVIFLGCGARVSGAGNAYVCVGEGREGS